MGLSILHELLSVPCGKQPSPAPRREDDKHSKKTFPPHPLHLYPVWVYVVGEKTSYPMREDDVSESLLEDKKDDLKTDL